MTKHFRLRFIPFFAALLLLFSLFITPAFSVQAKVKSLDPIKRMQATEKIDIELQQKFTEKDEVSFLIKFKEQANTTLAKTKMSLQSTQQNLSPKEEEIQHRKAVIAELKRTANSSQKRVLNYLEEQAKLGNVTDIQPFFIVNGISVTATKEVAEQIATFPEVAEVFYDQVFQLQEMNITKVDDISLNDSSIEWNVERVQAPQAWNMGYDGTGMVVAVMDSGVEFHHSSLINNYRGYNPQTGSLVHEYSWFDAVHGVDFAYDGNGHGTHVTGTIVGTIDEYDYHFGVAPGAKWVGVKIFTDNGLTTESAIISGAEWLLAPGGRVDLAPDVVNNSWSANRSGLNEWFRDIVKSWIDAEIFPVFSAGNMSETNLGGPGSIPSPPNYPESFAVGATYYDDSIAYFSLRGPSPSGIMKPDISAPGVDIFSSYLSDSYAAMDGTSMAAPAVAGVVALVKQADPSLSVEDIKRILKETADPMTDSEYPSSPNNGYGHGIVNAYRAVQEAVANRSPVQRVKGSSRFSTAVEISQAGWSQADTIILTRSDEYADALAGVPLAHALNAPILLTRTTYLPTETLEEIDRLRAKKVIVLGGTGAISEDIVLLLERRGLQVERISGQSRTDTAVEIAKRLTPTGSDKAIIVSGYDFPDALSVASQAALTKTPILLTHSNYLSSPTASALEELGVKETLVIGGRIAVSDEVMSKLPNPTRVYGSDRIATNIAIQEHFNVKAKHLYVATGNNFADSLTGAVLAANENSSILLVRNYLAETTKNYITKNNIEELTILGGTGAVSKNIENMLGNLLK